MNIPTPYLVFLGDAQDYKQAKVAHGIVEWRPELCEGQIYLEGCNVQFDELETLTLEEGIARGAKTLLIGISPYTTGLPSNYRSLIIRAMELGYNIASPLHDKLDAALETLAAELDVKIFNFRHRSDTYPKGNGLKRKGLRLLTVGTDCACGKKYTSLALDRAYREAGGKSTFRATGQTGFLISQSGINNDTIQADFLSGAAEWLTPDNEAGHWDIVEGQGALSHPSFGAGSLSLLYGSQPDVIVMCAEPGRATQRGVTYAPMDILEEASYVEYVARRTNKKAFVGAFSLFTRDANPEDVRAMVKTIRDQNPDAWIFDPHVVMNGTADVIPELNSSDDFGSLIKLMFDGATFAKVTAND